MAFTTRKTAAIRTCIDTHGLTYADVARAMDVTPQVVSRWNRIGWPDRRIDEIVTSTPITYAEIGRELSRQLGARPVHHPRRIVPHASPAPRHSQS